MSDQTSFNTTWGATLVDGGARFRLWAPDADRLSLRTPAGYCGVVGLRPTPGRCTPYSPTRTPPVSPRELASDQGDHKGDEANSK